MQRAVLCVDRPQDYIHQQSHIENLYKNIQTNNANRDLWQ
jgi:hypothetical protein